MSRFTLAVAEELAALSVRKGKAGSKSPLEGKGRMLRDALRRAENAHDTELDERKRAYAIYRRDIATFAAHENFYKYFSKAMTHWRAMKEPAKASLILYIQNHLQTIEQSHKVVPPERLKKRCDDTLEAIALAAHLEAFGLKGRRSGVSQSVGDENMSLRPLFAFGSELKSFWQANVSNERFGQHFDGEKPLSAASKLLFESAKFLKVKYKPANIKSVMRMLASSHPKHFLDDEFMISFRGLPDF